MYYEWDESKAQANLARHGVYFSHAERFDWSTAIEAEDTRFDYGEVRWVALGFIDNQLFVLVYTPRNATIRIISLRKATKREQVYYETQT